MCFRKMGLLLALPCVAQAAHNAFDPATGFAGIGQALNEHPGGEPLHPDRVETFERAAIGAMPDGDIVALSDATDRSRVVMAGAESAGPGPEAYEAWLAGLGVFGFAVCRALRRPQGVPAD